MIDYLECQKLDGIKEWKGRVFTEEEVGSVLLYRCETCAALIKFHDLDLIHHAEWHESL